MIPLLQTKTGDTPHMGIFANNTRLLSRLLGGAWPGTRLHIHGTTKLCWIQDWDDPCTSWLKVLDIGGSNVGLAGSVLLCNNTCVLCACELCACVLCACVCVLCACVLCACVCSLANYQVLQVKLYYIYTQWWIKDNSWSKNTKAIVSQPRPFRPAEPIAFSIPPRAAYWKRSALRYGRGLAC